MIEKEAWRGWTKRRPASFLFPSMRGGELHYLVRCTKESVEPLKNRLATVTGEHNHDVRNNTALIATALLALKCRRDDSSVRGAAMKLDPPTIYLQLLVVTLTATVGMTPVVGLWPKHSVSYRRPRSAVAIAECGRVLRKKVEAAPSGWVAVVQPQSAGRPGEFFSNQIWWKICRDP